MRVGHLIPAHIAAQTLDLVAGAERPNAYIIQRSPGPLTPLAGNVLDLSTNIWADMFEGRCIRSDDKETITL